VEAATKIKKKDNEKMRLLKFSKEKREDLLFMLFYITGSFIILAGISSEFALGPDSIVWTWIYPSLMLVPIGIVILLFCLKGISSAIIMLAKIKKELRK
jgi:hypothetical protein